MEKQGEALKKKAEDLKNPKASEEKKLAFIRAKQELDQKTRNFLRKVEQDEVKLRQDMVTLVFSATYEVARAKASISWWTSRPAACSMPISPWT